MLDQSTLLVVSSFILALAAILLLFSWVQHRSTTALVLWAASFALSAIATLLVVHHASAAHLPVFAPNVILAAAYGLMWTGARLYDQRSPQFVAASAGAVLTIVVVPYIYGEHVYRSALMCGIGVAYTLLTAREFWRGRGDEPQSRLPVVALLLLHAMALPVRIPLAANPGIHHDLLAVVFFDIVMLAMCGSFLLSGMVKDRVARRYMRDANNDPLTGVANRRYFLAHGDRIVQRYGIERRPVALLLFDLDRFKSINDRFGHAAGDAVLMDFCQKSAEQLRPMDLFARLGGEEFACLLPDTTLEKAAAIAERCRVAFESSPQSEERDSFYVTVSVGIAGTDTEGGDISTLLKSADRALYRAKRDGRNRVVTASPQHPMISFDRARG